jgi:hypothetical protein
MIRDARMMRALRDRCPPLTPAVGGVDDVVELRSILIVTVGADHLAADRRTSPDGEQSCARWTAGFGSRRSRARLRRAPLLSTVTESRETNQQTTDELAADRLVSPVPLPPDCPVSPARVKGGLRPSQATEQTALDP